jgi:CRISPR-associated protein Csb1
VNVDLEPLRAVPRLLIKAELRPLQGTRFQPTGFPDLGAAEYQLHDGTSIVLVESAQSMANRLEAVCWDEAAGRPVSVLDGLPYVEAVLPDGSRTSSLLEAHRLNSPYIVNSPQFGAIRDAIGYEKDKPFDRRKLAHALLRFDPSSLIHGIFLEKVGGVVRLPRALSAFIEARDTRIAPSGGVKFDRVQPETKETDGTTSYGKAAEGYGNVPFHRDEYTAKCIVAYFSLDLALLRGYGLGNPAERMLVALSLFKIRRFLLEGLRLRTACDLRLKELSVEQPQGWDLPELDALEKELAEAIGAAAFHFEKPSPFEVTWQKKPAKKKD